MGTCYSKFQTEYPQKAELDCSVYVVHSIRTSFDHLVGDGVQGPKRAFSAHVLGGGPRSVTNDLGGAPSIRHRRQEQH